MLVSSLLIYVVMSLSVNRCVTNCTPPPLAFPLKLVTLIYMTHLTVPHRMSKCVALYPMTTVNMYRSWSQDLG